MAIGSGSEAAQSELQEKYHNVRQRLHRPTIGTAVSHKFVLICSQQMTLEEAHSLVLKVLKQVMEEKLNAQNVQLSQVC